METQVRKFHNDVKSQLLRQYVKKIELVNPPHEISLMDIACGRGGDMHKWKQMKIDNVFAIDTDFSALNTARERYNTLKSKSPCPHIEFTNVDMLSKGAGFSILSKLKRTYGSGNYHQFDIVTMHFALQYFVDTPEDLSHVIDIVTDRMSPGGYFIGTAPRKESIESLLDNQQSYISDVIEISRTGENNTINFNVNLGDTSYFDEFGASEESLVDIEFFKNECGKHGLEMVKLHNFSEISPLDESEYKKFSDLYCFWVFHKPKQSAFFPVTPGVKLSDLRIHKNCIPLITKPHEAVRLQRTMRKRLMDSRNMVLEDTTILDATACVGGDVISSAKNFKHVVAIESDIERYEMLVHNVSTFRLENVKCINGDSLDIIPGYAKNVKNLVVYFDPPWGKNNAHIMISGYEIIHIASIIKRNMKVPVFLKLPRDYRVPENINGSRIIQTVITRKIKLVEF